MQFEVATIHADASTLIIKFIFNRKIILTAEI